MNSLTLLTWHDVDIQIRSFLAQKPEYRDGVEYRAYWDGLRISFLSEKYKNIQEIDAILGHEECLGNNYKSDEAGRFIRLGTLDHSKQLPVYVNLVERTEYLTSESMRSDFKQYPFIGPIEKIKYRKADDIEAGPICLSFHSFKGGVGRTLHALGLATFLVEKKKKKVLLVDADFEAPGTSWIFNSKYDISLSDLLILCHAEADEEFPYTKDIAAELIYKQSYYKNNLFFLPAFKEKNDFGTLHITPEHINTTKKPFRLQDLLYSIGAKLNVDYLIIDLRAGISDLAAPWLLDTTNTNIFVTTPSAQSLLGTALSLNKISEKLTLFGDFSPEPLPILVLSQVSVSGKDAENYQNQWDSDSLENSAHDEFEQLKITFRDFCNPKQKIQANGDREDATSDWQSQFVLSIEHDGLKKLNQSWEKVFAAMEESMTFQKVLGKLYDLIPSRMDTPTNFTQESPKAIANKIEEKAKALLTAEAVEDLREKPLLVTESIRELMNAGRTSLPAVVVVGDKGSGKTYLFRHILSCQTWEEFCKKNGAVNIPKHEKESKIIGLTYSYSDEKRHESFGGIREQIENLLKDDSLTMSQWSDYWLDFMAWRCIEDSSFPKGKGRDFFLKGNYAPAIFILDGIEDIFDKFATSQNAQTAIRALIQEIPIWIRSNRLYNLGIVVFVRKDIVLRSVPQNSEQLLNNYSKFYLKWNSLEALRLIFKLVQEYLPSRDTQQMELSEEDLIESLIPFWGRRIGKDTSREAITHSWVLGNLQNFRGEIQARDLIRFLQYAAEKSPKNDLLPDRILQPVSIRSAMEEVGTRKKEDLKKENMPCFNLMQVLEANIRKWKPENGSPYKREAFEELIPDAGDRQTLIENGLLVFSAKSDRYYIMDLIRRGFGISTYAPGRSPLPPNQN